VPDRKGLLQHVLRLLADIQRRDDVSSEAVKRIRARARTVLAARNFEQIRATLPQIAPAVGSTLKTQVKQLTGLGQAVQEDLLNTLREYFPDAAKGPAAPVWKRDEVLLCTSQGLTKREAELAELVNVKMRQNAIAIGEAATHGDLSENSEYKFALEERDLLRARVAQIQSELSRAKVLDPHEVPMDEITPGCRTRIRKTDDGQTMELMLLGPWEANVEQGVYNYKSPIGQALLGLHLGEKADLNIGMLVGQYEVLSIERGID
jgi:transcription elongation factor GreA